MSNKDKVVSDYEDDFEESEDDSEQTGGKTDELDDSDHLDMDPDADIETEDESGSEEYDPVTDGPEAEEEVEETTNEVDEELGDEVVNENETGQCYMKNLDKDFIVLDDDDSNMYSKMEFKKVDASDRITDPVMTYYEMVRIIGTRAQQFNFGAEPLVKGLDQLHPAKMAYVELKAHMTPYIIRRPLPNKLYEEWRVDELTIIHEIKDEFFVPSGFDMNSIKK